MANLQLDESTIKNLIGESLLAALDQQKRDALIKDALCYLVTQSTGQYGTRGTSPLQDAFRSAASRIADKMIHEHLEANEPFKAEVRKLFDEAWQQATMGDGRAALVERMAKAIGDSLDGRQRY